MYAYGVYRRIDSAPSAGSNGISLIPNHEETETTVIEHEYWTETITKTWQEYYLELDVVEGNELTLFLQDASNDDSIGGHHDFTIYSIPPATNGVTSSSKQPISSNLSTDSVQPSTSLRRSLKSTLAKAPENGTISVDGSNASVVTTGNTGYEALNALINKVGYTEGGTEHKYYVVEKVLSDATLIRVSKVPLYPSSIQ